MVSIYKIPMELVVKFDQTGLHTAPTGGTKTYAVKGSKEVRLIGQDDNRQITEQQPVQHIIYNQMPCP